MRDQLRITVEQYEAVVEEYEASNEELQAINQEFQIKINELDRANNDLQNLIASTQIGTIFRVVREIAQRHGGRVEVTSTEDQDSTFRVVLPLLNSAS